MSDSGLASLIGAVGSGVLQRTYLLETKTPTGIPRLLIVLDAVVNEDPEYSCEITEHPVEDSKEVTDHIQLHPTTLRLRGTVSNTPLDLATTIANLAAGSLAVITDSQARTNFLNAGLQKASGIVGAAVFGGASANASSALSGAADALARTAFLAMFERRAVFDVITKRLRYADMAIESIRFPRDEQTGDQIIFELELKQIRIVKALSVQVGQLAESVANSGAGTLNMGQQTASAIPSQTTAAVNSAQSATGFSSTAAALRGP